MATFVEIDVQDSAGRVSHFRYRVVDVPENADLATATQTVVNSIFGDAKLALGKVISVKQIIEMDTTAPSTTIASDVELKWQTRNTSTGHPFFRVSIPTRNPLATLLTPGSQILGDLGISVWTTYKNALLDASFAYQDPEFGSAGALAAAIAVARSRVRPRQGNT